ncbi:hypothetical protein, partial [Bartonella melophagi]
MSRTWKRGTTRNSGHPAVKVYKADITISGALKITDNGQSNNPAIQVYDRGVLRVNDVTATGVYKGIEVSGGGSSVTVVKGSIEVRAGGGAVIEVKNGGMVVLNHGVKVNGGGDNTGIEVGQGGGTVTLVGTNFRNVKTGIKFTGTGTAASVMGVGATINLASGGIGIKMEGTGGASVMNMTIKGSGTATGAEVTSGTLTVNTVTMTNVQTGMKVTGNGNATMVGGEIKGKGGTGTGVEMNTSGTVTLSGGVKVEGFETGLKVTGSGMRNTVTGGVIQGKRVGVEVSEKGILKVNGEATIEVTESNGVGLKVTGTGRANVVGGEIKGSGGTGTGVEMSGNGTVTLSGVTVEKFKTGAKVKKGTLKMMGESTISLARGGKYGVYVGIDVTSAELTGTKIVGGGSGYGVYAMGGNVTLEGVKVSGVEKGVYARKGKSLTISGSSSIDFKGEYGVYVGSGVTAELKGTVIRGGGNEKSTGVYAMGGNVTLEGVKVSGVEEGVVMMGSGTLTVERGTIELASGGKYGVYVGIDVTSASLTGTKIVGGGKGYGVYATGKKVTISGGEISKVITGV